MQSRFRPETNPQDEGVVISEGLEDSFCSNSAPAETPTDSAPSVAPAPSAGPENRPASSRRAFLARISGAAAVLTFGGAAAARAQRPDFPAVEQGLGREVVSGLRDAIRRATTWRPGRARGTQAFNLRVQAARPHFNAPVPDHRNNGDETLYLNQIGSYTKGLPHNDLGEVDLTAFAAYIRALYDGTPQAYDGIPQGGPLKFVSPQAAEAFQLEGTDSHYLTVPPAPTFASASNAAEMAELYWKALLRDVPFSEYASTSVIYDACADLSAFSSFDAPKSGGVVIPETLFRGALPGCLTGPYCSQFFMLEPGYGFTPYTQHYQTTYPGSDYMTDPAEFLHILRGGAPAGSLVPDVTRRYIRNGRDLAHFVHFDFPFQAAMNAGLILLGYGEEALDPNHPYLSMPNQDAFTTFGGPDLLPTLALVSNLALKAAWFQKWHVHRRLRPEQFAGRVHHHMLDNAEYPIHPEMFASESLDRLMSRFGSYLLPMAYPEGCPAHPAYPAGHATAIGATTTVLKAFFNENFVLPNAWTPNADGTTLLPYTDEPLTVGGELNKLAANVALGRDFAGMHWRSDFPSSAKLGEDVAIRLLTELKTTYNERFEGFTLTKFDGSQIVI